MAIATIFCLCGRAHALVAGSVPGEVPETTVNPAEYPGWTLGDPGWSNTSASGSNYVYLGDGWVLSARHVGYNSSAGVKLQTASGIESFKRIAGSYYSDYGGTSNGNQYAVSNPTTIQSETGQTISLADSQGTHFSDLQLFRIDTDPGLSPLTIASQPLPSNFTRANAPEVVTIGTSIGRVAAETHWNAPVDGNGNPTGNWSETTDAGNFQGYKRNSTSAKQFGTNRVTDVHPNFNGDPFDSGAVNYSNWFEAVISDSTVVYPLTSGQGTSAVTRDVIGAVTFYNSEDDPGVTDLEFQAIGGATIDGISHPGHSGSPVFHNRGTLATPNWELVGIVNAIFRHDFQPGSANVYGNATLYTDLWYYNQDYANSIRDIIESHPDYSHVGDVNLNGAVSGNGAGSSSTDDVTAFVEGWGYASPTGLGDITSWKKGDLNRDGQTDEFDYELLADALPLPGDYNDDRVVDASDYTVWRNFYGQTMALPNETLSINMVADDDYNVWRANYGVRIPTLEELVGPGNLAGGGGGVALGGVIGGAVPEPAALWLALAGGLLAGFALRKRRG